MFLLVAFSALLAAAAAQQCQGTGRPCTLQSSGTVNGGAVGVCTVSATSQLGQCTPQCRDPTAGCFLTTSSNALDGVCQATSMSQTPTCVAKSNPNPQPACTIDRPCTTSGNTVGICSTVNGAATCKPQCQQGSGPSMQAQACFLTTMSQTRDGVCNANAVCAKESDTSPTPPAMTSCPTGTRCRLSSGNAAGTVEVGVCGNNVCGKQCQQQVSGGIAAAACFTSFNVDAADGICENGTCKPKSQPMPQGCVNINDACVNANGAQGKCAKGDANSQQLQCAVLVSCSNQNTMAGSQSCTYVSMEGFVKPGSCTPNGCVPQTTPTCQLGAAGTPCKTSDGADGKVGNSCTCVKNDSNPTPVQQCSSNSEGLKCQTPGSTTFGICRNGQCNTGTSMCQVGTPCKTADGFDGKLGGEQCSCIKNSTPTPVQQCTAETENKQCALSTASGLNGGTGVCKQGKCVSNDVQPQCKPGDLCKTADGSDGKWTDKCECVKRPDPNTQCQANGDKCQLLTPGTNTMSVTGVCKEGKCVSDDSQPQCKPGDLCKAADGSDGKWTDKCECVKRPDPSTQCQANGDKCQLLTPGTNSQSVTGVCKEGKCVSGEQQPPKPCTNGAFCEPSTGQRGFCRNSVCEVVKCMSDDNCLSSDSSTKRVCLAFQCVPAPTTMTNPCSDNIKCENGGKCVVVSGANAGFTDQQLKQSGDIASTYNGLAGVCVCPTGFKGATCEIKIETMTEKPASCLCGNGMVSRENFCVQASVKACDCNKNCICTNDSSDQCTQPEKKEPTMVPIGSTVLLSVVFDDSSNLLQALGAVKSLLEKFDSVQISAEKTSVGLRVTVSVKGNVDPALVDSVKNAAASLRSREDVVDAVVQDAAAKNDPAVGDSASSIAIGASVMLVAAMAMN